MSKSIQSFAAVALALGAGFTQAAVSPTVIDFNTLSAKKDGNQSLGSSYVEDGYKITSLDTDALIAPMGKHEADPLGWTLGGTDISFRSSTGAAFDLQSLDLAEAANNAKGGNVSFAYTVAGGTTVSETLKLDELAGLQTFGLRLDNLVSFTLQSSGFQVDNIKVTPYVAATPAIPEPGSLALMVAGLGIVGTLARRRKV